MNIIDYFTIFVLGALIGSFLNVCIYRIPKGESIAYPPSCCPSCGKKIKKIDLIPIVSYLMLKGKCRHCKSKISVRYPIVEFFTALIFVFIYFCYGYSINSLKFFVFASYLIVVSLIDLKTTDVYLSTSIFGAVTAIVFLFINYINVNVIKDYIYGGGLGFIAIGLIVFLTKGMGWGDVEIITICGLFLGYKLIITTLFFAFTIGSIVSLVLIVLKKKSRKDYIPFGPFIGIGGVISLLCGNTIIMYYISLI